MDGAALSALAAALGAGLVEAMTTDAWHAVRDRISRIFGRGSAAREGETARRLESARVALRSGDPETLTALKRSLAEEWAHNLEELLVKDPALAQDFESVLKLIRLASGAPDHTVTQTISAQRDAYTAGGDQYIRIHPRDDDE